MSTSVAGDVRERTDVISVGEVAPDFVLKDQDSKEWRLSDAVKSGDVVLCFYPMDFSPVCSSEMTCLSKQMERYQNMGAQVVGISCDSFFVHKAWAESLGLKQRLLADMHREVCKAYGLYWPELNVSGRGTVIVGADPHGLGKVKWSQKREIKAALSVDELLQQLG